MIDDSDGDFALLLVGSSCGLFALLFFVLAVVLYGIASSNANECETRACSEGSKSRLLDGECVCVGEAKP